MLSNPASRSTEWPAIPARVLGDLVHSFAALFQLTAPAQRTRVAHWWWLAAFAAVGAAVRLWGLGGVGLHGDEETMAMAVRHILIDGRPILPSGMFYPRGLTELYLMALSVSIFGESEWALRLPSVLCGVALIGLSYLLGKRFLRPQWSLALAATVAFLPDLLVDSQTARMYIFMMTAVTGSMICLFAWERTDRLGWLVAAAAALIIGLDLHALTVATVLLFLFPGLVRGDTRRLIHGAVAAAVVGIAFVLIDRWVNAQYPVPPQEFAADLGPPPWQRSWAPREFALSFDIALWTAGIAIGAAALRVGRVMSGYVVATVAVCLLLAGVVLQLALFYHLAALLYLVGAVIALRFGSSEMPFRLLVMAGVIAVLTLIHVALLASTPGSVIKLIGAMVGQPSVWPYVRVAQLCVVAGVLTSALLAWGLYRIAFRKPVPDEWLLAVLGVWAPVFALGLFAWNVPSRYTEMSLPPMLLCGFAFAQRGLDWISARRQVPGGAKIEGLAAALLALICVNPVSVAGVVNAGYRIHPDHKGAAEFIQSQHITHNDVVVAEDVLQQTYYLGSVDYWLIGRQVARRFVKAAPGGGVVDFYTGTPVIATAAMLDDVLQRNANKRIFVIGSGEGQSDQRRTARGAELHEALQSSRFETVYVGRDGLTRVLRAVPGAVVPSQVTSAESAHDAAALADEAKAKADSGAGSAKDKPGAGVSSRPAPSKPAPSNH